MANNKSKSTGMTRNSGILGMAVAASLVAAWGFAPPRVKEANTDSGQVGRTIDGDTCDVIVGRTAYRVRLWGVDAPESQKNQPMGKEAAKALEAMCQGKNCTVHWMGTDRYGRHVAELKVGGKDVGQEMVRQGWAWSYAKFNKHSTVLSGLEDEARKARRGLWSKEHPVPPWEWRKGIHE